MSWEVTEGDPTTDEMLVEQLRGQVAELKEQMKRSQDNAVRFMHERDALELEMRWQRDRADSLARRVKTLEGDAGG